ncbi:MAG: histone deacetylase [Acidobacteriota bacterium]|nr:histone deacetylase [Acidobacteriota bacterium]
MNDVGYISPDVCLEHDTGPGHPERIARLEYLNKHLTECGLWDDLATLKARPATEREAASVHRQSHVRHVIDTITSGRRGMDMDTPVSARSLEAAWYAAGSALTGLDEMREGRLSRVFCGVRPPGHHAESNRAMGFCLFNNVAIAAQAAIDSDLASRVLIVDWDVHHGNGTQEIFETSSEVFYYSTHQFPFYPGTGASGERGYGKGEGFTLNRPLPPGTGDRDYLVAMEADLKHIGDTFRPDLVIISAGFDAHDLDPLGSMRVTDEGFAEMTRLVASVADDHAQGRILSVLEGGYDLKGLASSVAAHLRTLREG